MNTSVDIKTLLPHRSPMLMVDSILNIDDENIETVFTIKEDNIFNQNDLFTEIGLIENAAQTCSAIIGRIIFLIQTKQHNRKIEFMGFISSLKTIQIHNLPKAGSTITTKGVLISNFATEEYNLCTISCKTYHKEELLLKGELNIVILENPKAASSL